MGNSLFGSEGYRKIKEHPRSNREINNLENGDATSMKLNKADEQVVAALKQAKEMTLAEISEKTGLTGKKVFRSLRKLFEAEMINSNARKYRLLTDKPPVKVKGEEENPEPEE